jgi:hypothetical protein
MEKSALGLFVRAAGGMLPDKSERRAGGTGVCEPLTRPPKDAFGFMSRRFELLRSGDKVDARGCDVGLLACAPFPPKLRVAFGPSLKGRGGANGLTGGLTGLLLDVSWSTVTGGVSMSTSSVTAPDPEVLPKPLNDPNTLTLVLPNKPVVTGGRAFCTSPVGLDGSVGGRSSEKAEEPLIVR